MKDYEKIAIDKLKPYENNARTHSEEQIEMIMNSLREFGFVAPCIIDENDMILVGHGRIEAAKRLGIKEVPYRRITHLTEDQKKAYILADNKLSDMGGWDLELLDLELGDIELDMTQFGFEIDDIEVDEIEEYDERYTNKVNIPQYEITGKEPSITDLFDKDKTSELIAEIESSGVSSEQKEFLRAAAQRHIVFNYKNIAEYYAHQNKEMQTLMEKSALVIIDVDDAIAYGYARLSGDIDEMEIEDSAE